MALSFAERGDTGAGPYLGQMACCIVSSVIEILKSKYF